MDGSHIPLNEILRPQKIEDLILPEQYKTRLQRMIDRGDPPNLLLYGPPGFGKTSAARIVSREIAKDLTREFNGSLFGSVQHVRDHIGPWALNSTLFGGLKICFIDEADFVSKNAQASLRSVIEKACERCRFIMAANDVTKIDAAIQSRMTCIPFAIDVSSKPVAIKHMQQKLSERLTTLGIKFERSRLDQIVTLYFPDLRSVNNRIDFEFG